MAAGVYRQLLDAAATTAGCWCEAESGKHRGHPAGFRPFRSSGQFRVEQRMLAIRTDGDASRGKLTIR